MAVQQHLDQQRLPNNRIVKNWVGKASHRQVVGFDQFDNHVAILRLLRLLECPDKGPVRHLPAV